MYKEVLVRNTVRPVEGSESAVSNVIANASIASSSDRANVKVMAEMTHSEGGGSDKLSHEYESTFTPSESWVDDDDDFIASVQNDLGEAPVGRTHQPKRSQWKEVGGPKRGQQQQQQQQQGPAIKKRESPQPAGSVSSGRFDALAPGKRWGR